MPYTLTPNNLGALQRVTAASIVDPWWNFQDDESYPFTIFRYDWNNPPNDPPVTVPPLTPHTSGRIQPTGTAFAKFVTDDPADVMGGTYTVTTGKDWSIDLSNDYQIGVRDTTVTIRDFIFAFTNGPWGSHVIVRRTDHTGSYNWQLFINEVGDSQRFDVLDAFPSQDLGNGPALTLVS